MSAAATESRPVVHLFHHSFSQGGGVERYSRDVAGELVRRGRAVRFHARKVDDRINVPSGLEIDRVRSRTFPRKLKDYFYHRAVARLAPRLHGTQFAMTRVPARDGELCGGTHRGYCRDAGKWMGLFDRLQVHLESSSYRFTRHIISHSHLCTGELESLYGVPATKISTIHPPADVHRFKVPTPEQRLELRRKWKLPEDRVIYAFPSTGHKRKGLYPLIDAMRPFGDRIILAVAGRPPGNVPDFVRHLGYVAEMEEIYGAADFTAMASFYEPFGLIGVESLLCGTRLVFDQNMGCLEVVRSDGVIRFNVRQPETIRQAIVESIGLAATGGHHLHDPWAFLNYDPSVETHVSRVMDVLEPAAL